jgi:uncharacterized protein YbjT (DUF2867 family)
MSMKIAVPGGTGRVGSHVVDLLRAAGHEAVPISRSTGVDVVTGEGLAEALAGVEAIIDAATPPTPDEQAAKEFFTTAARNLQATGSEAGVKRIVVVSIIGTDRFATGYNAAKVVQEQAILEGPIPARVLRAAQFHEFVEQLVEWGTQGEVSYVPRMQTQLVAARTVAEELVALATDPSAVPGPIAEIAGPRAETLVEMAKLLVTHNGGSPLEIVPSDFPGDPEGLYAKGALLPGPEAKLAGPTFEEWLDASSGTAA